MCEVPCALLLSLGCLGVQGQSHLSELPGFHQWRASLTAHARAEQRLEAGPAPAETAGEQSSLQREQSSLRGELAQARGDLGQLVRLGSGSGAAREEENIDILNDIETSSDSFLDQLSRIFLSKNHQDMNRNANGKPEKNNLFDVGMVKRRENRGKLFNNYIHSFLCR